MSVGLECNNSVYDGTVRVSECLNDEDQDHRQHDGKGLHVKTAQSLQKSLA